MAEPEGLNLSLDELIAKRQKKPDGGARRQFNKDQRPFNKNQPGFTANKDNTGFGNRNAFHKRDGFQSQGTGRGNLGVQGGIQKTQQQGNRTFNQGSVQRQQGFSGGRGQGGAAGAGRGFGRSNQQQQQGSVFNRVGGPAGRGNFQRQTGGFQQKTGQAIGFQQNSQQFQQQQPRAPIPDPEPEAFVDEATGNVMVRLKQSDIMLITPEGDITLSTNGYFNTWTLNAFNKALKSLGIKVTAQGEPKEGNWTVSMGNSVVRYYDGIRLPAKGGSTVNRGQLILMMLNNPAAAAVIATSTVAAQATAASALVAQRQAALLQAQLAAAHGGLGLNAAALGGFGANTAALGALGGGFGALNGLAALQAAAAGGDVAMEDSGSGALATVDADLIRRQMRQGRW